MHDLFQARGFGAKLGAEVLVDVLLVIHARSRIADQLPSDQVHVAAVHRIREHAFDGVRAQQLEEMRFLERLQLLDLFFHRQ